MDAVIRNDFDRIYDATGPQGLTQTLRSRLGDTLRFDKELLRMGRSGKWKIMWDDETGEGQIVSRLAAT